MRVMRFYGWTWQQTMATPIFAFWTSLKYIDRLRAEEALAQLDASVYPHADTEGREAIVASLQRRMGTVSVEAPRFDAEGWNKLKNLSQL